MYRATTGQTILINPKPGRGDVVADIEGSSYVAECKGGAINSQHAGRLSRLRKSLCEAVGLSLATGPVEGRRQFAVAPNTPTTAFLAKKMAARARGAGIEIALVDGFGNVDDVTAGHAPYSDLSLELPTRSPSSPTFGQPGGRRGASHQV